jgi:hypothetical protein
MYSIFKSFQSYFIRSYNSFTKDFGLHGRFSLWNLGLAAWYVPSCATNFRELTFTNRRSMVIANVMVMGDGDGCCATGYMLPGRNDLLYVQSVLTIVYRDILKILKYNNYC